MTAGTYNIVADQGATFSRVLTWKNSAGTAINLTGYTAEMQIRPTVDASTASLTLSTTNGRIALGGAAGTITLTVQASDMAALAEGQYVHDLELTSSGGAVTRLVMGTFTVRGEVTR